MELSGRLRPPLKLFLNQMLHISWSRLHSWTTHGCCAPWAWGRALPCGRPGPAPLGSSWWRSCSKEKGAGPKLRLTTRSLILEKRAQSDADFVVVMVLGGRGSLINGYEGTRRPGEPHVLLKTDILWGVTWMWEHPCVCWCSCVYYARNSPKRNTTGCYHYNTILLHSVFFFC